MAIIGPEVLEAVDADTPPDGLVYDVRTRATNGRLAFVDMPQRSITMFTQDHVNSRRVVFLHNGSREPDEAVYLKAGTRALYSDQVFVVINVKLLVNVYGAPVMTLSCYGTV